MEDWKWWNKNLKQQHRNNLVNPSGKIMFAIFQKNSAPQSRLNQTKPIKQTKMKIVTILRSDFIILSSKALCQKIVHKTSRFAS